MEDLEAKRIEYESVLAFGNADGTLPYAEDEVKMLDNMYSDVLAKVRHDATKELFEAEAEKYEIIHLATHGRLRPDSRRSHFVLSPRENEVGNLTVRDILGMCGKFKEKTSLVTLSACETAVELHPDSAGKELITLANAFKNTGVPALIGSLWQVATQSTVVFMEMFYNNLKNPKMDKLESLRQAQITFINSRAYSHPLYWAPFVLVGHWE
jgi:CHAT domain-containing protein